MLRDAEMEAPRSMSYAIDERDAEPQLMLAKMLNPLTEQVIDRVPRAGVKTILDLACGQGHTTRMQAARFPCAAVTGFEFDSAPSASG